jgi:hypothetical protein
MRRSIKVLLYDVISVGPNQFSMDGIVNAISISALNVIKKTNRKKVLRQIQVNRKKVPRQIQANKIKINKINA